jgi:hypothetical protein
MDRFKRNKIIIVSSGFFILLAWIIIVLIFNLSQEQILYSTILWPVGGGLVLYGLVEKEN